MREVLPVEDVVGALAVAGETDGLDREDPGDGEAVVALDRADLVQLDAGGFQGFLNGPPRRFELGQVGRRHGQVGFDLAPAEDLNGLVLGDAAALKPLLGHHGDGRPPPSETLEQSKTLR